MKQVEEIKALIREMMDQEMENYKEAVSIGAGEASMSPGIYTMLQVLLAKIEKIPDVIEFDYATIRDALNVLDKKTLCRLISDMMFFGKIDITDINQIYTEMLKEKIAEKDRIIREADNCIFKSLAYDHMNEVDFSNVILEKVRWRYKYADTNKEALCEMFNYDPEKDNVINRKE